MSCSLEQGLKAFEKREEAWVAYGQQACKLMTHCIQACDSGHSSAASCEASVHGERSGHLMNEVNNRFEIYGCAVRGSTRPKTLTTSSQEIQLIGDCEDRLFYCEKVHFIAREKDSADPLELLARVRTRFDPNDGVDLQRGYEFSHGSLLYFVSNAGSLPLTDTTTSEVVLKETGMWKR